jgi:PST family polysaccharide transporter
MLLESNRYKNNMLLSNIYWISLARMATIGSQFVSLLVLARLLGPDVYGQMAVISTALAFSMMFIDLGTGAALIQKKIIFKSLYQNVNTLNIYLGITLSIFLAIIALPLSIFVQLNIFWPLIFTAIIPIFSGLSIAPRARLERHSKFRTIFFIDSIATLLSILIAITLAFLNPSVYVLVIQSITSSMVIFAFLIWKSPIPLRWKINKNDFTDIFTFSSNFAIFNFMNFFHRNADTAILGSLSGVNDLGAYNLSYRFVLFPIQNFSIVMQRAAFPHFSRMQDDRAQISQKFTSILYYTAIFSSILMAFVWSLREPIVYTVLGPSWRLVVELLAWMAPLGFLQATNSLTGFLFNSLGRSDLLRRLGQYGIPLIISGMVVGYRINGTIGLAQGYFFITLIWSIILFYCTARILHLKGIYYILRVALIAVFGVILAQIIQYIVKV